MFKSINDLKYLHKISVLYLLKLSKVQYMINLFNFLQYRQKILVLDYCKFLSVEYKFQSIYNFNVFSAMSYPES